MRKPFMAGNWKLNMTITEAVAFVNTLKAAVKNIKGVEIAVCPTAPALKPVADALKGSNIGVGAQNVYWEDAGAFTGEISAAMLLDAGCRYVIIGHSERRQYFGETNATVNKRLRKALARGLTPIVCVGETLAEREADKAQEVVGTQVREGLKDLTADEAGRIVIAYEPVWAIGTGRTATPAQAQEMHAFIRGLFARLFSEVLADGLRIQYGGSVKADNVKEIMSQPDVDGALVGGAALKVDQFQAIVGFKEE